jgi:hypothetical protein
MEDGSEGQDVLAGLVQVRGRCGNLASKAVTASGAGTDRWMV